MTKEEIIKDFNDDRFFDEDLNKHLRNLYNHIKHLGNHNKQLEKNHVHYLKRLNESNIDVNLLDEIFRLRIKNNKLTRERFNLIDEIEKYKRKISGYERGQIQFLSIIEELEKEKRENEEHIKRIEEENYELKEKLSKKEEWANYLEKKLDFITMNPGSKENFLQANLNALGGVYTNLQENYSKVVDERNALKEKYDKREEIFNESEGQYRGEIEQLEAQLNVQKRMYDLDRNAVKNARDMLGVNKENKRLREKLQQYIEKLRAANNEIIVLENRLLDYTTGP